MLIRPHAVHSANPNGYYITAEAEPDPYNRLVLLEGSKTVENVKETMEGPRDNRRKIVTATLATKTEGGSVTRRPIDVSWLGSASSVYQISADIKDYIFVSVPIVTANFPNRNMDCLVAGTLVQTNIGAVPIEKLPESGATHVLTPYGVKRIHNWERVGYRDTVSVRLEDGRTLRGTPDHKVMTVNRWTLGVQWKGLGDLNEDDFVIGQTGDAVDSAVKLPEVQSSSEFLEAALAERNDQKYSRSTKDVDVPNTMTPELARLLGHLVAEGAVTYKNTVAFYNDDPAVLEDFCHCWNTVFGADISPKWDDDGHGHAYGSSVLARSWLANIGLAYVRANKKRVPWSVMQSGAKLTGEFLRSFIAGDGCVSGGIIQMHSSSRRLLREIQNLLLGFGIHGRVARTFEGGKRVIAGVEVDNCKPVWQLRLTREESTKLTRQTGPVVGKKGEQEFEYELALKTGIPFAKEVLRRLAAERRTKIGSRGPSTYRTDNNTLIAAYFSPGSCSTINKANGMELLDAVKQISPEIGANLEFLCRQDITTAAVARVKESPKAWVYDIGVEEAHCFVANGVVAHNCFTLDELTRFSPTYGRPVYQSFIAKPTHADHQNQDNAKAKGVHFDSTLRQYDVYPGRAGYQAEHTQMRKLWKVRVLTGWCRQKDPKLVQSIMKRERTGYSMGAFLDYAVCSVPYCAKVTSGKNTCPHKGMKGKMTQDGYIIYDLIQGTCYFETSSLREEAADLDAYAPDDVQAPHLKWDANDIWSTGLEAA